ncbi:MAG: peptidoglycan DD-metalloendopeptidase family protein [Candidatus Peregrinibacteria bacterium]|nr:peptidoglycan DD-metalloendopeptidase family protein [Candidatus Peregrinibacteria bacterium]
MNQKFNKYITITAILSLLVANTAMGYADEAAPQIDKNAQFLDKVKQQIDLNKTDYKQLLNNVSDTKMRLDLVSEEKTTLQQQLKNIDARVDSMAAQLLSVTKNVIEKENEISLLYEQIDINQVAMNYQAEQLKDYVKTIYTEENSMLSHGEDGSIDAFKLLLTDGSVGENMRQLDYFNVLDAAGKQMVEKLDDLGKTLKLEKDDLEKKRVKLASLQADLASQKKDLDLQKQSKQDLLKITMGQEDVFKKLLEQTIQQQDQMVQDIKSLGNALEFLQDKIALEGDNFDISKYKSILDFRTQALYAFQMSNMNVQGGQFAWPVEPSRGISAYFHDPRYVGVFGVQHNAVDIPQYQSTPIRAAADAVVYVARDNGYGYSYIILSHAGGFMTVYGHVSSILVTPGQKVSQGAIIGLTGGMPGTPGAGYMTTGPHLHFEVHFNGKNVDPLMYLPLTILSKDQVNGLPKEYQDLWSKEIMQEIKSDASASEVAR